MENSGGGMTVFKKKYRYIQTFNEDVVLKAGSHLGFYSMGSEEDHSWYLESLKSRVLFPHYGFSFYDDPPGRIIRKGKGDIPSIFQSRRLFSLGLDSLMKQVKSFDMFTDDGLAQYRELSVLMMMGNTDTLFTDLQCLCDPVGKAQCDERVTVPLIRLCGQPMVGENDYFERLHDIMVIYEEAFHLDIHDDTGYLDFIYLTANTMISLELSHRTVLNIIRSGAEYLKPLFQSPLNPEWDKPILKEIFSFNETNTNWLIMHDQRHQLFGVFPGIFGFEGAVFDVATGLVSGKRKNLVRFLLFLNGMNLLAERDLRYLV